ncbi:MAG: hypothetical protein JSR17_11590 [Proteobacteria bacterium]|nr:hypothetical protein [Pseudomonadota bacterium]
MSLSCPCGLSLPYEQCCGKFIEGNDLPQTPEALMRSRYSAYTKANVGYIAKTMRGEPLADFDPQDTLAWLQQVQWEGLKVIQTKTKSEKLGFVSFEARYNVNGEKQAICEKSEFHKIDNQWFYVGGKMLNPNKKW